MHRRRVKRWSVHIVSIGLASGLGLLAPERALGQTPGAAQARRDLTELEVAGAAADAFLTVLAADETVRAARANVDRLQVFSNIVGTLVTNQLRPGADQSRANAELAIAKNQVSQAAQAAEIARASLANLVGAAGTTVVVAAGRLSAPPAVTPLPAPDAKSHPLARIDFAAIDAV